MANGWNEWSIYVLKEIERLSKNVSEIYGKIEKMGNRILINMVIAVIFGLIGGAVMALIIALAIGVL